MTRLMLAVVFSICFLAFDIQAQTKTLSDVNNAIATAESTRSIIVLGIKSEANSARVSNAVIQASINTYRANAIGRLQAAPYNLSPSEIADSLAAGDAMVATADWLDECGDDYYASGDSNLADSYTAGTNAGNERDYQTAHNAQYDVAFNMVDGMLSILYETSDDYETADDYYSGSGYYYMQAIEFYSLLGL